MKTMIVLALVATFVAYTQAAAFGDACDANDPCGGANQQCASVQCKCVDNAFEVAGTCYKNIGQPCSSGTDCFTPATCDTNCVCPDGTKADANNEKCSGAAGMVVSLMTMLMAFAASRMM